MTDKLVVGHKAFMDDVRRLLEATDVHSCQEQDGTSYGAMAKELWARGYRFDPEARKQWLIVELRSCFKKEDYTSKLFSELLALLEVEA